MACGVIFNPKSPEGRSRLQAQGDDWLKPILATGAFDVVNVHDYYVPGSPEINGWTFESYLQHVRNLAAESGAGPKPVWITETGYVSEPIVTNGRRDEASPEAQAIRLAAAYRAARATNVERMFWLFLRDAPATGYFGSMGLAEKSGQRRPAWQAFIDASR